MIKLTCEQIIAKIKEKKGFSEEEVNAKIKEKLDQLAGLVSRDGAAHIVSNELGVNAFEDFSGPMKINKLLPGMRNVTILAKVLAVYDVREFSNERGAGKVGSFAIADETGRTRASCWHAATEKMTGIKTGDVVRIKNTFCRENKGQTELSVNDASEIEVNPAGETVDVPASFSEARSDSPRKKISELTEKDLNVELLGTVVQAFEPKFFEICPQCGKRARARENIFVCDQHDTISPDYSYVMNAVIDDGSETIRAVFFREQFEQLVNKPREEVLKYREFAEKFNELKLELLGQMVKLQGRVTKNSMFDRLEFVARTVITNPDPREELERLKKEVTPTV